MYKDKDKQREANRQAAQRRRDKLKGMTIDKGMTKNIIPKPVPSVIPEQGIPGPTPTRRFRGELTKERQVSKRGFNE